MENEQDKHRRSPKLVKLGFLILILGIITGGGAWYLAQRDTKPVPKNIRQAVNFPVYYPLPVPKGYHLKKDSFNVQNNIVFYSLIEGDQTVSVSEQPSPPQAFDFSNTPGFGEIPANAGDAHAGVINGSPVAIVVTEKTMINLQGSKNVPRDVVAQLAQAMAAPSQ